MKYFQFHVRGVADITLFLTCFDRWVSIEAGKPQFLLYCPLLRFLTLHAFETCVACGGLALVSS